MIRVSRHQRPCTINLFCHHDPDKGVRQSQARERPTPLCLLETAGCQAIRPPHQQRNIATVHAPRRELTAQLFRADLPALHVEGDQPNIPPCCGQKPVSFLFTAAAGASPLAAVRSCHLHEFERAVPWQSTSIVRESGIHPPRGTGPDCDQPQPHPVRKRTKAPSTP